MPELPKPKGSFSDSLYKIERNQTYLVVKQNQIVQNTHYTMPLADQKILASLISSIKPGQRSLKLRFSTRKYMKILGLRSSGTTFGNIMYSLKHIADDSFYIKHPDGTYDLWRWLSHVHADPNHDKGDFIVTFPKELKPYLFNSQLRYKTIYKFSDIMLMKSKYSPRLYEIFKSNRSRQKVQKRGLNYSLKELKYMLNLMYRNKQTHKIKHRKDGSIKFKYPKYYDFKRNVLIPSYHEINRYTEYNLRLKPIHHHSRKTVGINVVMLHKNKKQMHKRDDLIFFKTHHIPRKEWKTWREDTIRGKFHQVHPRNTHGKVINGKYRIIKPSQSEYDRKEQINKLDAYFDKHKIPFKEINLKGDLIKYYSPLMKKYVWTTRYMRNKQIKIYKAQKNVINELKNHK